MTRPLRAGGTRGQARGGVSRKQVGRSAARWCVGARTQVEGPHVVQRHVVGRAAVNEQQLALAGGQRDGSVQPARGGREAQRRRNHGPRL